jgi:hypothetical protein
MLRRVRHGLRPPPGLFRKSFSGKKRVTVRSARLQLRYYKMLSVKRRRELIVWRIQSYFWQLQTGIWRILVRKVLPRFADKKLQVLRRLRTLVSALIWFAVWRGEVGQAHPLGLELAFDGFLSRQRAEHRSEREAIDWINAHPRLTKPEDKAICLLLR